MEWGFKQLGRDEPLSGSSEQFAIGRKVHNFVRESIQNSWDQRHSSLEPVQVVFSFIDLEGDELDEFLKDINWDKGLEEHLRVCAEQNNHDKNKLKRNLRKLEQGRMRLLRVSDFNTKGLSGPEFGDEGNFCKLCRNRMIPSEGRNNAGKGGSFGVGKSVYWSFSGLNTVVFSSVFADESQNDLSRVFGRTYLPDHKWTDANGQEDRYSGDAFMCVRNPEGDRMSADFGSAGVGQGSLLYRNQNARGTSILVVMYEEVESEGDLPLAEVAMRFRDAVIANFWPLLHENSLEATVEWRSRGGAGSEVVGIPEEFDPFVRALSFPQDSDALSGGTDPDLLQPGDTAYFSAAIKVSARTTDDDPQPAVPDGEVAVCVTRLTEEEKLKLANFEARYGFAKFKFVNRLANIRGAKMVVENREYVTGACYDHVGVVRVGRFRDLGGNVTPDDEAVEQFLRDSEPPAHDEWQFFDKVRHAYASPWQPVVSRMYDDIGAKARKLLRAVLQGDKDRPDGLARLLAGKPVGGDEPIGEGGFRYVTKMEKCTFDIKQKVARCTVSVKRVGSAKLKRQAWVATVGVEAAGEQGDESLHHVSGTVAEGFPASPNGPAMNVRSYSVSVPANQDKFVIDFVVSLSSLSDVLIRRLRLQLNFSPKAPK